MDISGFAFRGEAPNQRSRGIENWARAGIALTNRITTKQAIQLATHDGDEFGRRPRLVEFIDLVPFKNAFLTEEPH